MTIRLLPLVAFSLSFGATAHADIIWETNYDTARAKSMASGKPLFVDVYTDWCGWCKKLDSTVYPDARIQQMSRSFVMLRLNAEGNGAGFAKLMQVTSYPTLLFATTQGVQVRRIGYVEPQYFASFVEETLRRNGPIRVQSVAQAKTDPGKKWNARTTRRSNSVASSRRNWKKVPEIRPAITGSGYRGAYVLSDNGVVALDAPSQKTGKAQKTKTRVSGRR